MIWLTLAIGISIWIFMKVKKTFAQSSRNTFEHVLKEGHVSGITISMEMVRPDPAEWAREREAAKKIKQESINRLMSSFVRPSTIGDALAGMQAALAELAGGYRLAAPDFDHLWSDCQAADLKKTELKIRKKINENYKQRSDSARLLESLALCLLHTKFMIENLNSSWKVSPSIKRLLTNLNHEKYRSECIGFLYSFADAVKSVSPELVKLCEAETIRIFNRWHSDIQANQFFEENLRRLAVAKSASDKHFTLNALVEYLAKRRRFDPSVRDRLVELCENDISIYKTFLADFACIGDEKKTFQQALKSEYYMCPYLPSFNAIWDLYEEEGNGVELRRLHKLAKEIRYGAFADDDALPNTDPDHQAEEKRQDPCPVEIIEAVKSGKKGKQAFIDSEGNACSTEEAAQDYFRILGYGIVRGEVQFWQAMFGLAFWEEIFEGTGAPNGFTDIPPDLFAGCAFYEARKEQIDRKFKFLNSADIHDFISSQLQKHGKTWTRIIFDGGQRDFAYREILESVEVSEFLKVIKPDVFAKIVYRIAQNPTENRAGTPDYSIWKGSDVSFIEVKGIREKIRETQINWLTWMHAEGMPVKIIRVKGKSESQESEGAA